MCVCLSVCAPNQVVLDAHLRDRPARGAQRYLCLERSGWRSTYRYSVTSPFLTVIFLSFSHTSSVTHTLTHTHISIVQRPPKHSPSIYFFQFQFIHFAVSHLTIHRRKLHVIHTHKCLFSSFRIHSFTLFRSLGVSMGCVFVSARSQLNRRRTRHLFDNARVYVQPDTAHFH